MPSAHEPHAAAQASRSSHEPTILVRKLGIASVPTYLERELTENGENRFIVVERVPRAGMTDDEVADCLREARMTTGFEHPNVVPTRAVTVTSDEISVTSDYVAGERLSDLWSFSCGATRSSLPLEIALRILVDVATGLGALHKLRTTEGTERSKFVHGEVTAANVLVGLDGISVLLRAARVRRAGALPQTGIGAMAPELLAGAAYDPRADVYALGALLWQALSRKPLFCDDDLDAITSAKRSPVERPAMAGHPPWAMPLADVAARALAPAPDKRFPTAASMITEVRKIAGPKMAAAEDVARFVEANAGTKIAARLADVQASAVIRKATSIPAPQSLTPPELSLVERGSGPSRVVAATNKSAAADLAASERRPDRPTEPQSASELVTLPARALHPARSSPAPRQQSTPSPPARPRPLPVPSTPSPRASSVPLPALPSTPLPAAPSTPSPRKPSAPSPPAPSAPSPLANAAPAPPVQSPSHPVQLAPSVQSANARPPTGTRSEHSVASPAARPATRALSDRKPSARAVSSPGLPRSPLPSKEETAPRSRSTAFRIVVGVWIAIALLTVFFGVQAIRHRQEIAATGTSLEPTTPALESTTIVAPPAPEKSPQTATSAAARPLKPAARPASSSAPRRR